MKLRKGKISYRVPPAAAMHSAAISKDGVLAQLSFLTRREGNAMVERLKKPGVPQYLYWDDQAKLVFIFPPPDRAYTMILRYVPPLVEI